MATQSANAVLQDQLIGHQVDLIKLEGTVRADVLKVLKELEGDLIKRLNAVDPTAPKLTAYQQQRLKALLKQTQGIIGSSFGTARKVTNKTLTKLAAMEAGLAAGSMNIAIGTNLGLPTLNRQQLQEIVADGFIQGAPSREWWAKQAADTAEKFRTEMRLGTLAGENVGQLANRVRKIMDVKRYQAEALARTSVNSVANLTRLRTYAENAHLIKAIKWVSTLDSRTTDTCKGLDGLMWDPTTYAPIGHSVTFPGPTAHWNCRSTQVPVTYSFEELAKNPTKKGKRLAKKLDAAGAATRSALDGQVPKGVRYEDWLAAKELAEPGYALTSGALTPAKYALWKQGKLDFKGLIDQTGNPLTVEELTERLKDIIPATALPAAALAAQQQALAASSTFHVKQAKAQADAITAQEALDARIAAAKEKAKLQQKSAAQEQLKAYAGKDTAPSAYHYGALKDLTKQKGGAWIDSQRKADPVGLLELIDTKAAKKKLSVDLAHYKQAVTKGKKPSAQAQAAFEALPDEAQKDVLDAIKIKQAEAQAALAAEQAAAAKQAELAAANAKAAEEIADTLANPTGKTKLAKALQDLETDPVLKTLSPYRKLAKAKELASAAQAQAEKSAVLSGYKKKLVSGEAPTPKQSEVFNFLTPSEKAALTDQIEALNDNVDGYINAVAYGAKPTKAQEKAYKFLSPKGKKSADSAIKDLKDVVTQVAEEGAAAAAAEVAEVKAEVKAAKAAAAAQADVDAVLDMKGWTYSQPKPGGSVPGAVFKDEAGQEWLVKYTASEDVALNEVLTAKLYRLAGIEAPDMRIIKLGAAAGDRAGKIGVASRWIEGLKKAGGAEKMAKLEGTYEGFAADAWLADWDVVGLSYDNIAKTAAGRALRIDVGGGLRYRAQGTAKGANFTTTVDELQSLRNGSTNKQAAAVFKDIPEAKIEAGVSQIVRITDSEIDDLVEKYGPRARPEREKLATILKARRDDLKKRYPHLVREAKAPPPPDLGKRVSNEEYKRVTNARATGYSIRSDYDAIEDQQILIHHETTGSAKYTVATMKLRGDALSKFEASVSANKTTAIGLDHEALDNKLVTAIKGIAFRANRSEALELKDVERVQAALEAWKKAHADMTALIRKGAYTTAQRADLERHYKPWLDALETAAARGSGKTAVWTPPTSGNFAGIKLPAPKVVGQTGPTWTPVAAEFDAGDFSRGHVTKKAGGYRGSTGLKAYETTLPDGTTIRVWDSNTAAAMRGRVEIRVKGQDVGAANRAVEALDEATGIDTALPTAAMEEELYLTQLAYARKTNWRDFEKKIAKGKTPEERVEIGRSWISRELGYDIEESGFYDPAGSRGAFETGRVHRFRADLLGDPGWARFERDYRLYHHLYDSSGINGYIESIDKILSSGGRMAPTTDKLRLGIIPKGMSPESDLGTGGADFFFTRIKTVDNAESHVGLTWKAREAARVDAISYDGDKFGRTDTTAYILRNRKSSIEEMRQAARNGSNETILKGGSSLFDNFDAFIVPKGGKARFIRFLREKHGYTQWPDGRSLDEVVREAKYS